MMVIVKWKISSKQHKNGWLLNSKHLEYLKKKHFLGALVIITEVYYIPHIALVVRGTNQFLARSMGQLISWNFLANILHNRAFK